MCNLYSIKTRRADLAHKFRLSDNRMGSIRGAAGNLSRRQGTHHQAE
jgi:hypothetical protein